MSTTFVPRLWTYDVFVSFRGEDIRKSFMDHLFKDFEQKGIRSFRDDIDVSLGEKISSQLDKVIEESRFLIVILSKNYASSSWCLRELVKILECKQMGEHKHEVRIIFYDVKPDEVRKQTGSYAEAFAKYEFSNGSNVAKWKEALYMATNLSGWDLQDMANGYESKFIDNISKEILKVLCHEPLYVGENLVGVDAYVNEMNLLRFIGSNKVHMIGICGISGIGKTALAKAIYNSMCIHFEVCSFCEDVQWVTKQQGLPQVQMQLIGKIMKTRVVEISNVSERIMVIKQRMPTKPILLVLDDVDHREQLEALAGSRNWFSPGSFIIFTGQDKQLLRSHKVDEIYDIPFLPNYKALELFSLYAFGKKHPTEHFIGVSDQVVDCLQGHPLALKVLGCFLYDKPMNVWKSELDELRTYPDVEIQQKLRPSFDGLDFNRKRIFLDIAISFIGENKDFVASVLGKEKSFAYADMEVLVNKSLITISQDNNSLQMNDLIRSMARRIIHEEFVVKKAGSILWNLSEVCNVLSKNKAIEAVEVLDLSLEESSQHIYIDGEGFEDMKNLRILKICDAEIFKCWHPFELNLSKGSKVTYSGRLKSLSNKLKLLYWHGCPFEFPSDFYPENIVAIDLSYSHIKTLWTTPKCFARLKVMKLRHCRNLTSTPDFTRITNLEELILEGCLNLVKFHPSFGMLKKLVILNLKDCKRFKRFPTNVEMGSRHWTSISRISWLPSKIQHPKNMVMPSFASLCSLRELDLSHCNILEMSNSIEGLLCLEDLYLCGNNFTRLPGCLSQLPRLKFLSLARCKKLEELPELPPTIQTLFAKDCTSLKEIQGLSKLHTYEWVYLNFMGCPKLFRDHTHKSELSMSQPSQSSGNQFSAFLRYMNFPSNTNEIFGARERPLFSNKVEIVYHGNRIPKWFTNRSKGNHVKVELPQDWCYNNKYRGYGVCVVFTAKKSYSSVRHYNLPTCLVNNFDGTSIVENSECDSSGIFHESVMIWFHFTTEIFGWMGANNFATFSFIDNDDVKVRECGVRLIFDQDIEKEETNLSFIRDLPTPTRDGGTKRVFRDFSMYNLSW